MEADKISTQLQFSVYRLRWKIKLKETKITQFRLQQAHIMMTNTFAWSPGPSPIPCLFFPERPSPGSSTATLDLATTIVHQIAK